MKESLINKFISPERFNSYQDLDKYSKNLIDSKNFYISLSILEVSLKNSIDELLTKTIGIDWIEDDLFLTKDSLKKVKEAKNILFRRGEKISKSKVIAELSFGFWVNLFKKPYSNKLRTKDFEKIIDKEEFSNIKNDIDEILEFFHNDVLMFSQGFNHE